MGRSEGQEQTAASTTGQSNMQFAAKTPIAVTVIGSCPITRTFAAPTTKSGGTAKIAQRGTGEGLLPGSACAGASSAVGLTPPDHAGSGEHRRWRAGRDWNLAAQHRSSMAGFARRLSFGRKSKERSRLSPTSCRHVAKERASSLLSLKTPADEDSLVEEPCKWGGQLGSSGRDA